MTQLASKRRTVTTFSIRLLAPFLCLALFLYVNGAISPARSATVPSTRSIVLTRARSATTQSDLSGRAAWLSQRGSSDDDDEYASVDDEDDEYGREGKETSSSGREQKGSSKKQSSSSSSKENDGEEYDSTDEGDGGEQREGDDQETEDSSTRKSKSGSSSKWHSKTSTHSSHGESKTTTSRIPSSSVSSSKSWSTHPTKTSSSKHGESATATKELHRYNEALVTSTMPVLATWSSGSSTWTATQGWTTAVIDQSTQTPDAPMVTSAPPAYTAATAGPTPVPSWKAKKARMNAAAIASASSKALAAAALATAAVGSTDPAVVFNPQTTSHLWLAPSPGQVYSGGEDVVLAWRSTVPPSDKVQMRLCLLKTPNDLRIGSGASCGDAAIPSINKSNDGMTYSISFAAPNVTLTDSFYIVLSGLDDAGAITYSSSSAASDNGQTSLDSPTASDDAAAAAATAGWSSLDRERRRRSFSKNRRDSAPPTDSHLSNAFVLAPFGTDTTIPAPASASPDGSDGSAVDSGSSASENKAPPASTALVVVPSVLAGVAVLMVGGMLMYRRGRKGAKEEAERLRRAEEEAREKATAQMADLTRATTMASPPSIFSTLVQNGAANIQRANAYHESRFDHRALGSGSHRIDMPSRRGSLLRRNSLFKYGRGEDDKYTKAGFARERSFVPTLSFDHHYHHHGDGYLPTPRTSHSLKRSTHRDCVHSMARSETLSSGSSSSSYAASYAHPNHRCSSSTRPPLAHPWSCYESQHHLRQQHQYAEPPFVVLTSPTESERSYNSKRSFLSSLARERAQACTTDRVEQQQPYSSPPPSFNLIAAPRQNLSRNPFDDSQASAAQQTNAATPAVTSTMPIVEVKPPAVPPKLLNPFGNGTPPAATARVLRATGGERGSPSTTMSTTSSSSPSSTYSQETPKVSEASLKTHHDQQANPTTAAVVADSMTITIPAAAAVASRHQKERDEPKRASPPYPPSPRRHAQVKRVVSAGAAERDSAGRRGSAASWASRESVASAEAAADLYEKLRNALLGGSGKAT
ncbi:hypothetical protein IE53DRAFT_361493 [Violaceomyces palustris]|uniref:Uncharacterized protein n=1 Tax=Violaceomyces palustris TaxID=1673888 RepID=A0ACD0P0K1_9BASI|nr:hypothetical protein IE53DRAFT_361493 [Violaceomyces palustris]